MAAYDRHTALIVVDVQNDFADPQGALAVAGGDEVVTEANAQIALARASKALVVYTQDWHPEHTPHFERDGGIWPVHCVKDTWGASLHPGLTVTGQVVRKGEDGRDGYSAFSVRDPQSGETASTAVEALLRAHDIGRVVTLGLATDYCVVETVLDARMLGFEVEVVADAIRAVDLHDGDGARAITRMRDAGADVV